MTFSKIYSQDKKIVSLEFFPPKKPEHLSRTLGTIEHLSELNPDFMTVTYGAGGGTRDMTKEIVSYIQDKFDIPAVAHLTCVNHSKADVDEVVDELYESGIRHILALRGDPPIGQDKFEKHPEGFANAMELCEHLAKRQQFSLAVAGYPEGHQEAESVDSEIEYLKKKVDAGADVVISQLFFDVKMYTDFIERTKAAGIEAPIVPGIMPIRDVGQLKRFTQMCGASIPDFLMKELSERESDPEEVRKFGAEYALKMCQELLDWGAPGIHLYTLNHSKQVEFILSELRS